MKELFEYIPEGFTTLDCVIDLEKYVDFFSLYETLKNQDFSKVSSCKVALLFSSTTGNLFSSKELESIFSDNKDLLIETDSIATEGFVTLDGKLFCINRSIDTKYKNWDILVIVKQFLIGPEAKSMECLFIDIKDPIQLFGLFNFPSLMKYFLYPASADVMENCKQNRVNYLIESCINFLIFALASRTDLKITHSLLSDVVDHLRLPLIEYAEDQVYYSLLISPYLSWDNSSNISSYKNKTHPDTHTLELFYIYTGGISHVDLLNSTFRLPSFIRLARILNFYLVLFYGFPDRKVSDFCSNLFQDRGTAMEQIAKTTNLKNANRESNHVSYQSSIIFSYLLLNLERYMPNLREEFSREKEKFLESHSTELFSQEKRRILYDMGYISISKISDSDYIIIYAPCYSIPYKHPETYDIKAYAYHNPFAVIGFNTKLGIVWSRRMNSQVIKELYDNLSLFTEIQASSYATTSLGHCTFSMDEEIISAGACMGTFVPVPSVDNFYSGKTFNLFRYLSRHDNYFKTSVLSDPNGKRSLSCPVISLSTLKWIRQMYRYLEKRTNNQQSLCHSLFGSSSPNFADRTPVESGPATVS